MTFEFAILILIIIILVVIMQQRQGVEGGRQPMTSDQFSPPPGYQVATDSDGNPILVSSSAVDGGSDDSSAVPMVNQHSQLDLRNTPLVSVGGKTGYYSEGSFVPLYGRDNNDTGAVTADISSMKSFGSVDNTAIPSSNSTMSAVVRGKSSDQSEDINWDRSLATELSYTPGSDSSDSNSGSQAWTGGYPGPNTIQGVGPATIPHVLDHINATFGSVPTNTGQPYLLFGDRHRGSQNKLGSILHESRSTLPVFDIVPMPSVNPQLKAVAAATSLQADPFQPPADTAYPTFG